MVKKRLPPMTKEQLLTYFARRGYRVNPLLQDSQDADMSFTKPLPNGRQKHVRVWVTRKGFRIEEHVDYADPYRDPVAHFVRDVLINGVPHTKYHIPRKVRPYGQRFQRRRRKHPKQATYI